MRVLLGLMKPESGTVTYMRNGQVVHNLSVGYLPQYSNLDRKFPISVYDVVLSGLKKDSVLSYHTLPNSTQGCAMSFIILR